MASEPAERPLSLSPEQETFELTTTVDPSYIIHLIRQLLPNSQVKESMRQTSNKVVGEDAATAADEIKDSNEKLSEQQGDNHSCLMDACADVGKCKKDNDSPQASIIENQTSADEPYKRVTGGMDEAHQPPSNVSEEPLRRTEEALPSKVEDETPSGCTGDSDEQREEAGCMLWDLAATQSHAEFMSQGYEFSICSWVNMDSFVRLHLAINGPEPYPRCVACYIGCPSLRQIEGDLLRDIRKSCLPRRTGEGDSTDLRLTY